MSYCTVIFLLLANNFSDSIKRSAEIFTRDGERTSLVPLRYSLEEVDELDYLFHEKKWSVRNMSRSDATKENFEENAGAYSIIHVATHGISENDQASGLFFFDDNSAMTRSFFNTNELYQMNLSADLVVFSPCKSAVGDVKTGEGVMALPRGFMYAGVPHVVASLWKIHDEKTKLFMLDFYTELLSGENYSQALRNAKLKALKKKWLPLDWAGFVLLSE